MTAALESLVDLRKTCKVGWIETLREEALANFLESGLPTRNLEDWKGTNFAPLGAMHFTRVGPGNVTDGTGGTAGNVAADVDVTDSGAAGIATEGPALVFVDGRFDAAASQRSDLPDGVRALSLAEVLESESAILEGRLGQLPDLKRQSLVALQTAFLEDGAVLVIEAGARPTRPIRTRFISTAATNSQETPDTPDTSNTTQAASAAFPRMLVLAGEGSSATLLQEHLSVDSTDEAPGFTGFVAEFFLAEGARLETVQIQAEGAERIHFTSAHARLERNARLHSHVFSLGNGLVRSELEVSLTEPGAETTLCGLFVGRDHGHTDHFTTVDHAAEQCTSDEEYRGVLGDHSQGVFRGRVLVRPGAQKTDARQSNPNLLLSEHAHIDTKPQLEIYADDIRASHGSTIGQLDSDALFFLQARGISAADARLLLTGAFAKGIVDRISDEDLRRFAGERVDAALRNLESGHSSEEVLNP
jgi:Fe-S cluster assembly protein SufD